MVQHDFPRRPKNRDLLFLPALTGPVWARTLRNMNRKTVFTAAGLIWELLRFVLLFLFLWGCGGISLGEGNFFLLIWGASGFPFTFFLWLVLLRLPEPPSWVPRLLAAGRGPSLIILITGILGFFFGRLPGRGDWIILQNEIFAAEKGFLVLLFLFLLDFLFFINLLLLGRKEA